MYRVKLRMHKVRVTSLRLGLQREDRAITSNLNVSAQSTNYLYWHAVRAPKGSVAPAISPYTVVNSMRVDNHD